MKKSQEYELRRKADDLNALCGIGDFVFNDGPARGVRAFDLNNGSGIRMTVMSDRGLDIPYLFFRGCAGEYALDLEPTPAACRVGRKPGRRAS